MIMKRFLYIFVLTAVLGLGQSCKEQYVTYADKEYVMFADTAKVYVLREDILSFDVPVVSTVARPYDRTFAVEILDAESSAAEMRDFRLESNNFIIKAGELSANVRVTGIQKNLEAGKEKYFTLKLVAPKDLVMDFYGDKTKVRFQRYEKFRMEKFTGWAVVSSMFLFQFSMTGSFQRLIHTHASDKYENGVVLENFLRNGYDVTIVFDDDTDPLNPTVNTPSGQVVSDEANIFGMVHGDDHILIEKSSQGPSYFFGHAGVAVLVNRFYVENIGDDIGTVGHFLTEIDWVSDEEAQRLKDEDGF